MSEDGGPAFPADPDRHAYSGMSLRDAFALAALMGFLANEGTHQTSKDHPFTAVSKALAAAAYEQADAMLAEREPTEEER